MRFVLAIFLMGGMTACMPTANGRSMQISDAVFGLAIASSQKSAPPSDPVSEAATTSPAPAGQMTSAKAASPEEINDQQTAIEVVDDYYRAIDARDYERAYAHWENGGLASGQSFTEFAQGFSDTAAVEVEIATPEDIQGAAGSSYVTLPVTITAVTTAGETQRFDGTYVLRRRNDESATPVEQRGWHIYSADISS